MIIFSVIFLVNFVFCDPQLDIPVKIGDQKLKQKGNGPEVLVIPNSYTDTGKKQDEEIVEAKSGTSFDFDRDRSQRFG
jgi:hypothetical protein